MADVPPTVDLDLPPLTLASVYRLRQTAPMFLQQTPEGDVAFYGLMLTALQRWPTATAEERQEIATDSARLVSYLERQARDELWEYHHGYGTTSADSAHVLEGLLAAGCRPERLLPACDALVARYFDAPAGGFRTVNSGRAGYWHGVSCETTAHVAHVLGAVAPERYAEVCAACRRSVVAVQRSNGLWVGKWYPSAMVPTWYAIRLLARGGPGDGAGRDERLVLQRTRDTLVASQEASGGWRGSTIETAAALLTLERLGTPRTCLDGGVEYLRAACGPAGWPGEPVLYYWYELDDQQRFFHHGQDRGVVTAAWAVLALAACGPTVLAEMSRRDVGLALDSPHLRSWRRP